MDYQNPQIPEGINVSPQHPLKEFALLLAGVAAAVILLVLTLSLLAGWLAPFIAFEQEQKLANHLLQHSGLVSQKKASEQQQQIEHHLQQLADKLAATKPLAQPMPLTVHYVDNNTVNALATLGGHIVIFKGLLDVMPHENALAMVLAHEIAHIHHRDPIIATGRGLTVVLALTSLAGIGDGGLAQKLVGDISLLSTLSFSRRQEEKADLAALNTLTAYYGHSFGADVFFDVISQQHSRTEPPQWLSSHPASDKRMETIRRYQQQEEVQDVLLMPLPEFIRASDR